MNYYPYYNFIPNSVPSNLYNSTGLFSKIFKGGINWGNILNNTQKTLNIINQTIPVVKQVTPVVKNAKTMFKVLNEFKRDEKLTLPTTSAQKTLENETNNIINAKNIEEGPTFFA